MQKIILKTVTMCSLLSACSGFEKNQTTTCQDGEVLIIKKGQFFPYTYTLTGMRGSNRTGNYGAFHVYIPKDKLENYVVNHNYRKDGTKRYNNTDKVIRVYKSNDDKNKRSYTIKGQTYNRKGICVNRDELIYIDTVSDIGDIVRDD